MFVSNRILPRFLFFILFLAGTVVFCLYHGFSAKERTILLIDEMIQDGKLIGNYWHAAECRDGVVMLTKYGYSVNIASRDLQGCCPGEGVSFIARKVKKNKGFFMWILEKVHLHGTSTFKFWISGLGILFVLVMCFRHFGLAKGTWSLTLKEDSDSCQTD